MQPEDDFLASLDLELAKYSAKSNLQAQQKALRAKASARTTSSAERGRIISDLGEINRELEAIQWKAEATVAVFSVQHCDYCGSDHRMFIQHMQRQVTVAKPLVRRWVRTAKPTAGLPKECMIQASTTHICADCLGDFGYDLTVAAKNLTGVVEPIVAGKGYEQGEMIEIEETEI